MLKSSKFKINTKKKDMKWMKTEIPPFNEIFQKSH